MKSPKVKKIILVGLTVLLAFIWWDNLKLFYQSEPSYPTVEKNEYFKKETEAPKTTKLAFKTPRVNPFAKADFDASRQKTTPKNESLAVVNIEKPSSRHRLLGVLNDKKRPQAVINSSEGNTAVLSISDSLISWELVRVDTNLIVFKNDKLLDTLWLETKASQQ